MLPLHPNVSDRPTSTPARASNGVANSAPQNAPVETVVPDQRKLAHFSHNDDGTPYRDCSHASSSGDQGQRVQDALAALVSALTPPTSGVSCQTQYSPTPGGGDQARQVIAPGRSASAKDIAGLYNSRPSSATLSLLCCDSQVGRCGAILPASVSAGAQAVVLVLLL